MKFVSKIITVLLVAAMLLALTACNPGGDLGTDPDSGSSRTVSSISIATEPTKKDYLVGEELDLTGGVLTVYYSDGTSATVAMTDADVTASADMTNVGSNVTVTVTYSGRTATYRITITEPVTYYTVTFDLNYPDAPTATQEVVESGRTVVAPADPERDGYRFAGWYTEAEGGESYAFGPVTQDITLYAHWADENSVILTMLWNTEGRWETYQTQAYESGNIITSDSLPSPTPDGYLFMGWYTDEELAESFSRGFIYSDMVLYAKLLKEYIFEAEETDISNISGTGYSNARGGRELIFASDDGAGPDMQASGGYYIAGLYVQGNELVFVINAEEAVTDAVLVLRLAAEFRNIDMSSDPNADDYYTISVNGTPIEYSTISLVGTDIPDVVDGGQYPFEDYTITTSLSLQEGENVIRLITSNANAYHVGTMRANAPMVDCIKIYTSTVLTWTPINNIDN